MSGASFFERHGLTRLINVSGTETGLGAVPASSAALAAASEVAARSVSMLQLQSAACHTIARVFGAEAGLVAHCSAAGISTAIAAAMTGTNRAQAERLPDITNLAGEVILQRGHNINYGGHLVQNVALTGARIVEVGAATECGAYELEGAINEQTAAALYVVSHHTVQSGMIDLAQFCAICHEQSVPVIVDAAAEPDPRRFLAQGADIVVTSMHKSFRSLTAAVISGRLDLVRACLVQEKGIARAMKPSKEAVAATIAALELWERQGGTAIAVDVEARLKALAERLSGLVGTQLSIVPDATSGHFPRLHLQIDPVQAPASAAEIARRLTARDPAIHVRSTLADLGLLQIDLRHVDDSEIDIVAEAILECYAAGPDAAPAPTSGPETFPLPLSTPRR